MKTAKQAVKAANLWADNAELELKAVIEGYRTSPAFFLRCYRETCPLGQSSLQRTRAGQGLPLCFLRTQVGEDLMYT